MEIDVHPCGSTLGRLQLIIACILWVILQGLQCREYCNVDTFQADCGDHQVVLMTSARYGRMHIGKCIQQDLGHVGCHADVLIQLDAQCSGRKRCTIANLDAALRDVDACSELVKYLDVVYKCIPVMSVSSHQCQTSRAIFAPPPPSHLANIVTKETGCGGLDHPWVIEVDVTKRINITLIDFGLLRKQPNVECVEYGVIQEPGIPGATSICGQISRMRAVYLSKSHRVEITLKSPDEIGQTHFLIEYEAVGCPTPANSDNMWLRQEDGHVSVGCHGEPGVKWQVTCVRDTWIGHIGNCSGTSGGGSEDDAVTAFFKSMPRDLLIYIIAALCVLLLLLLVIVIMVCTHRFCPKDDRPDVYELAVRSGDQPVAIRTPQQQTPHPQHTVLITPNNMRQSPHITQQHQMAEPMAGPTTLPVKTKRTPPKPTPRRTLARKQVVAGQPVVQGPHGQPAVQGPHGQPAVQGPHGQPAVQGPHGQPAVQGPHGQPAVQGPHGQPAVQGPQGQPAVQGPHGQPAVQGPHGQPAVQGPHGQPAVQGPHGQPAVQGPHGQPAVQGPHGQPAVQGPHGQPAVQGPHGQPAVQGPHGQPAVQGPHRPLIGHIPASPTLQSPDSIHDTNKHSEDTYKKLPRRHSGRKPEQGVQNEPDSVEASKSKKPTSYRRYPSTTSQSRSRPQPSAPVVEDMGFV